MPVPALRHFGAREEQQYIIGFVLPYIALGVCRALANTLWQRKQLPSAQQAYSSLGLQCLLLCFLVGRAALQLVRLFAITLYTRPQRSVHPSWQQVLLAQCPSVCTRRYWLGGLCVVIKLAIGAWAAALPLRIVLIRPKP
jgi:hypothetical protein